tara:strand:- start:157 stop:1650 length:1494 start_codon:yes stop_codon:yes gene_type:complete
MKAFLIIPMGGRGKRFIRAGYKVYKPFLKIDRKNSIFESIISNFKEFDLNVILIGNKEKLKKYKKIIRNKKIFFINIKSHDKGPVYSIKMGMKKIKKIVKDNQNIFVSYSDIFWKWDLKSVKDRIKKNKLIVFSHTNFHPHLEVNSKSDFCKIKGSFIKNIREKKTFTKNYQNEHLAIGCYYFKNLNLIENFFNIEKEIFRSKKEVYLVSVIKFFLKRKIKIFNFRITKFAHLGTPDQFEDFMNWKKSIQNINKKIGLNNNPTIVLMAGKGLRMKKYKIPKPFLDFEKKPAYKFILDRYSSRKKILITLNKYSRYLKNDRSQIYFIKPTKSLIQTLENSTNILYKTNNYLLTSCDCIGDFRKKKLLEFVRKNNLDVVIFSFKFSNLQKKLSNSHTQLMIKNSKILDIMVKKKFKENFLGHAGLFWIKSGSIFKNLENFKLSKYNKNLKREALIDDYFKYLIKNKKARISFFELDNYIHIGSMKEYDEYIYWKNFFND